MKKLKFIVNNQDHHLKTRDFQNERRKSCICPACSKYFLREEDYKAHYKQTHTHLIGKIRPIKEN